MLLSTPLAAMACSSSSGSPGTSDAGVCGGFGSPMADCNTCLTSKCCADGDRCHANSECQALFDCIKGCSDSPCETSCESAHPMGFNDLDGLFNCVNTSCPVQCGVVNPDAGTLPPADGGNCGGYGSADATCNACFKANCCQEGAVCAADAACNSLLFCIKACNDQTCVDNCNTMYASGKTDFTAFNNCLAGNCNTQCAGTPRDAGPSGDAGMCGGYGSSNPTCNTCLDTSCCSQAAACGASADCNSLFACVQKCPKDPDAGPPCANACGTQYPNGVATYNAFNGCMNTNCNSACTSAPPGGD